MDDNASIARKLSAADESDETLVAAARAGDAGALEALVSRHLAAVYQAALRVVGDVDAAQDVAQEAWMLALRALPGYRGDASFRTWLLRIALNAARSSLRRQGRKRESALAAAELVPSSDADPSAQAVLRTETERMEQALARLPEKQRLAVSFRTYQGLSHREVAALLDCTEESARVNYHHGIKRLRELLR